MKVGDLVKLRGAWVKANSWMEDTELNDSPDEYGIIIEISGTRQPLYKVLWPNGLHDDLWEDEIKVINEGG